MAGVELRLHDFLLDLENPRISRATSQREALQKIIEDQDVKLVVLAESIVEDGLNPMDRWLVLKSIDANERGKFVVLEGNRRLATIRLLNNRAQMDDLEVRTLVKNKLIELSEAFDLNNIEPISCFEVPDRPSATAWITQRHTGENRGRGIVNWGGVATARFRGRDPALQALDLVLSHGDLADEEKAQVEDQFPITTLDRLLSTPGVRTKIGVEIANQKLTTDLPPDEAIRPLRRMVLDLGTRAVNVTALKSRDQMVEYISNYGKDLPNLAKRTGAQKAVDEWGDPDFRPPPAQPARQPRPRPAPVRRTLIPRDCHLTVSNAKIAEITKELRTLNLADFPHAISVLFRVFLEQSVDHYLTSAGILLDTTTPAGKRDKNLRAKVGEAIAEMVKRGTQKRHLAGVERGIDDKNSPLFIDALHDYVHNRFYSPKERDLKVAWDNSQVFFEQIWQ
jgi:hypothetical protein